MLSRYTIEKKLRRIVAKIGGVPEEKLDLKECPTAPRNYLNIDSIGSLILREQLERTFQVEFSDETWITFESLNSIIYYIQKLQKQNELLETIDRSTDPHVNDDIRRNWSLSASGDLYQDIEIGMPLMGIGNLAENRLLMHLGDLRWTHVSALTGVPTKQITDADGNRLYSTFFYVEVAFPEDRPMACYGENDRIKIIDTVKRFGDGILDGVSYLLPSNFVETDQCPFNNLAAAVANGIPAVRLSSIFVRQFNGSEWLKRSQPSNPGFRYISELTDPPDSYESARQAGVSGQFKIKMAEPYYEPLLRGPVRIKYELVPERDLNGVGLVYFAQYPLFLDIIERKVLVSGDLPLEEELLNRRTIVRRHSAYLSNASIKDTLEIEMEAWIHNPFAAKLPTPEAAPIRLLMNYRMFRTSDMRLMMVSTAKKEILGKCMADTCFLSKLSASSKKASRRIKR